MSVDPLISVVIPNWNGAHYLARCLRSLLDQAYGEKEVILVDNASSDGSVEVAQRTAPQARILRQSRNLGFAGAVNAGVRGARGAWIGVLNNDTEAEPAWLQQCADAIERHPDASFLACRILDYSVRNRVYSAGDCFLRTGIGYRRGQELPDCGLYGTECGIFSACGCAALYRRSALQELQGFDDSFFAYLEDVELGLRLQAKGHIGYYIPSAVVYHIGGASSGGEYSSLSVRLRTRNSLLLLLKSMPGRLIWRWCATIALGQSIWLARAVAHGKLLSYSRGVAGVVPLLPKAIAGRRALRSSWRDGGADRLGDAILKSEELACGDYRDLQGEAPSAFLNWYFGRAQTERIRRKGAAAR
jgi:GT2 family glycosyltransferase